jgi:hypothetical protein
VVERGSHLIDTLESHAKSGEPLDIQHEFQKLTFDIIGTTSACRACVRASVRIDAHLESVAQATCR